MAYIGQAPANKPVSASDLEDGIITNAKLAQDIISAETELATAPASTDEFLISDAGVLKRLDASLVGGGKINQVVSTHFTTQSQMSSSSFAAISGCTVDITPSATSSKVFVMLSLCAGVNASSYAFFKLYRGSTLIGSGSDSSNRIGCNFSLSQNNGDTTSDGVVQVSYHYLDSPSSTSALTYTVQASTFSNSTITYNKTPDNSDNGRTAQASSVITVIEVLA